MPNTRKGQPLGLIAYAGSAHLVLPPTRDTAVVASLAAEISPQIMPQPGDDLARALQLAADILKTDGGSAVVLADTVTAGAEGAGKFSRGKSAADTFSGRSAGGHARVSRDSAPASSLDATVTRLTPDTSDVRALARTAGQAPVAIGAAGQGTRWAETGWWLVPVLTLLSLTGFRRVRDLADEATR